MKSPGLLKGALKKGQNQTESDFQQEMIQANLAQQQQALTQTPISPKGSHPELDVKSAQANPKDGPVQPGGSEPSLFNAQILNKTNSAQNTAATLAGLKLTKTDGESLNAQQNRENPKAMPQMSPNGLSGKNPMETAKLLSGDSGFDLSSVLQRGDVAQGRGLQGTPKLSGQSQLSKVLGQEEDLSDASSEPRIPGSAIQDGSWKKEVVASRGFHTTASPFESNSQLNPTQMGNPLTGGNMIQNRISDLNPKPALPTNNRLSGGEFLSTLGMVRSDTGNPVASKFMDSQSDSDKKGGGDNLSSPFELGGLKSGAKELKAKRASFEDTLQAGGLQAGAHHGVQIGQADLNSSSMPKTEVTANVVPGAMAENRVSTDGLMTISAGVRNLNSQGGGEMRVRLKPDNLGELNVRVVTDGVRVGLQIQASDEKAKKVIEESMTHLKESLSAQNLSLSQIDVTVVGSTSHSAGNDPSSDQRQFQDPRHSGFQESFGQNSGQNRQNWQGEGSQRFGSDEFGLQNRVNRPAPGVGSVAGRMPFAEARRSGEASRLDVTA